MKLFSKSENSIFDLDDVLPDMQGVQDVGVAPGEALSTYLDAGVAVELLAYPATVILHLVVEPREDRVAGRDLSGSELGRQGPWVQVELLHPLLVLFWAEGEISLHANLLQRGVAAQVKELGRRGRQKLVRVATCVCVSWISVNRVFQRWCPPR